MMKRMNESRTLPQARATMLEASPPRNAAAGTAGRSRGATHATRREALESAPARGSGRPGRDRWGEQPGKTGPKPQRWLPQEAPLFTRGSSHALNRGALLT